MTCGSEFGTIEGLFAVKANSGAEKGRVVTADVEGVRRGRAAIICARLRSFCIAGCRDVSGIPSMVPKCASSA
jgi:hypothetical protein